MRLAAYPLRLPISLRDCEPIRSVSQFHVAIDSLPAQTNLRMMRHIN